MSSTLTGNVVAAGVPVAPLAVAGAVGVALAVVVAVPVAAAVGVAEVFVDSTAGGASVCGSLASAAWIASVLTLAAKGTTIRPNEVLSPSGQIFVLAELGQLTTNVVCTLLVWTAGSLVFGSSKS